MGEIDSHAWVQALYVIDVVGTTVGCSASLLLMWLIKKLQLRNDFNMLLFYMGVFEFIAFSQFYAQNLEIDYPNNRSIVTLANVSYLVFANTLLVSYMISAFMSFMLYRVIIHQAIFKIDEWRNIIIAITTTPSIICFFVAFVAQLTGNKTITYLTWLATEYLFWIPVTLNVYFYVICQLKVNRIRSQNTNMSIEESAIINVLRKFRWYPLLQVLARFPLSWYLYLQSKGLKSEEKNLDDAYLINPEKTPIETVIVYIISQLCLIIASVGFVVVFVIMNPKSQVLIRNLFSSNKRPLSVNDDRSIAKLGMERENPLRTKTGGSSEMTINSRTSADQLSAKQAIPGGNSSNFSKEALPPDLTNNSASTSYLEDYSEYSSNSSTVVVDITARSRYNQSSAVDMESTRDSDVDDTYFR